MTPRPVPEESVEEARRVMRDSSTWGEGHVEAVVNAAAPAIREQEWVRVREALIDILEGSDDEKRRPKFLEGVTVRCAPGPWNKVVASGYHRGKGEWLYELKGPHNHAHNVPERELESKAPMADQGERDA